MVGHSKVVEMQDASDFYRFSSKSDWYFIYNIPDSLGPQMFIKSGVDSDIGCTHHFFCKLSYSFDSSRCPLFEST